MPPSVQLDGLDISFDAAPPPQMLPENVALRRWSVYDEVPDDLVGVYDVVHIRTFSFVLKDADIPTVLEHLAKLLSMCRPIFTSKSYLPLLLFLHSTDSKVWPKDAVQARSYSLICMRGDLYSRGARGLEKREEQRILQKHMLTEYDRTWWLSSMGRARRRILSH